MTSPHAGLLAAGGLLALAILESPLRRLIGLPGDGLDRLLAELLAAVDHGRAALAAVRVRVASGVGVLPSSAPCPSRPGPPCSPGRISPSRSRR